MAIPGSHGKGPEQAPGSLFAFPPWDTAYHHLSLFLPRWTAVGVRKRGLGLGDTGVWSWLRLGLAICSLCPPPPSPSYNPGFVSTILFFPFPPPQAALSPQKNEIQGYEVNIMIK